MNPVVITQKFNRWEVEEIVKRSNKHGGKIKTDFKKQNLLDKGKDIILEEDDRLAMEKFFCDNIRVYFVESYDQWADDKSKFIKNVTTYSNNCYLVNWIDTDIRVLHKIGVDSEHIKY